ncbi:putative Peptide/nickel transport system substrate-binding protein [Candidatus Promineifilum breve]|uniref:Peptide/nickel transport system substrate-binding protein n=1 Tax=Candidatus Promineifilum breve TaxID=1806508 RepID=A0A160T4Q2_9CHLR|nr:ABC transporter substrate-binding protein [Candidatus Promineifilum breve]CUS04078.2 putative Peptide/nickel transport system substrate-binding protein [Candidatus Promineifilum breve]
MLTKNRIGLLLAALLVAALALVACQPTTQVVEVTRVVTETVTEEGQEVVVTSVVTEVEEVVVTATPEPVAEAVFGAADPETLVVMTTGDMDTVDPALNYETAGGQTVSMVYETLIWYNGKDGTTFTPVLATEVPSLDNGGISEDGLTYTFNIREGVVFHQGQTLEPSDVAYSWARGILQSDPNGPQWLMIEPIMGIAEGDITYALDAEGTLAGDPAAVAAHDPAALAALCEEVKSHLVADDAAGTFTVTLSQPWGPFLATITQGWGSVLDSGWAAEQGDWDGDCATWQNFYAPGAENSKLTAVMNGTNGYMLDHWTPGEEYVLTAFDGWWRTADMPQWEGGPAGPPAARTVIIQLVNEWGTRFAALQAGDAAWVAVPSENEPQVDPLVGELCDWETGECVATDNPDGPLRKFADLPTVSRTYDAFLTFQVDPASQYIGSGQLDGNGIPPDFFNDVNVRKAMATCFDYELFNEEALLGKGVRNNGPIIKGMLGYPEDGPMWEYDPEACAGYLAEAWDGALPETGFRFQAAFNTGSTTRQIAAEIWQAELQAINELYLVEVIGLPWPTFLRSRSAHQLPFSVGGWIEDIHDPHNWTQPYTVGTFAARQVLPDDLRAQFQDLVTRGVLAPTPEERAEIYAELQLLWHETVPTVVTFQEEGTRYEQRWVNGWYYRIGQFGTDYRTISLTGQ